MTGKGKCFTDNKALYERMGLLKNYYNQTWSICFLQSYLSRFFPLVFFPPSVSMIVKLFKSLLFSVSLALVFHLPGQVSK